MPHNTNAAARVFVCGTRAVLEESPHIWRVVCATCEAGGSVPHKTKAAATSAAVRDSAKACRACGAV